MEKIKDALLAPTNVIEQGTINERGEIIDKKRLTHNQSKIYNGSGTSVNSRVQEEKLHDCMYGSCLLRLIHAIVEFRRRHPNSKILLQKIDFKSAYRRLHLGWKTAIQTITQYLELAFISLRLTFGGSPNPSLWGDASETTCDLAHAILNHPDWDPSTLSSPITSQVPPDDDLPDDIPFAPALPTIVKIDINTRGVIDVYIDDLITAIPDLHGNRDRAKAAVLLAIHIMGRPLAEIETILRDELVSLSKLLAESNLSEIKIFLGWKLDTRRLMISLPADKYKVWKDNLQIMIKTQRSTHDELDTAVGRLTHLSVIIQSILHFMSRLRFLKDRSIAKRVIVIPDPVIEDLKMFIRLLELAYKEINMNIITYRSPTHLYRSDACPAGLGRYNHQGRAWRFHTPKHLQFRATLNFLERIACEIGPWIDLIEGNLPEFSCILSQTDSTTAAGWLRKSNFPENDKEHEIQMRLKREVSRAHAIRMLNNVKTYSQ